MATLQITTKLGSNVNLQEEAIDALKTGLRGELVSLGDDKYDEYRKVWNGMIDRKPALIVRCAGVADVISAVNFARENNLLVAVRGGGHNVSGNAVCDGGIVIDLASMTSVRVDPEKRTAQAEPGATWADFDHETHAFGLAVTGGVIPSTGIAGLTLGGGMGWLMRKYGLSIDNLLSVDIVTADGQLLKASRTENAELFWGIRGGGGNFGVVTSFEYQLHPVDNVIGGLVIHPLSSAKDVLKFYREFTSKAPDELTVFSALLTSPEGDAAVALVPCYCGDLEQGQRELKPLKEFGPPVADHVGPMPYTAHQRLLEAGLPPGKQNYWKSNFLKDLSDDAIDVLVDRFGKVPSPNSMLIIENVGGAVSRPDDSDSAFNHRNVSYDLLVLGMWSDPKDKDVNVQWVRDTWDAVQPFSTGTVYVNYMGGQADEGANRIMEAYGQAKYDRLVALKNRYDPTNLFSLNQNIEPTV